MNRGLASVSLALSFVLVLAGAAAAQTIDVRPGTDRNVVNPNSKAMVPVALLGSETFQVNSVTVSALRLSAEGATTSAQPQGSGHLVDINHDGYDDLLMKFSVQSAGVKAGDTQVCLSGAGFQACDSIETVPN